MADSGAAVAAAPAAAKAAKKPRKTGTSKPKKVSDHPKYSHMIKDALGALKERGGSSRQAILKYIVKQYRLGGDDKTVNAHLKLALRAGVKNGTLKQSKGTGASGSFRIGEKKLSSEKKKPKAKAAKKTGAAKPKKARKPKAAKAAGAKKPKAAGSPKKATKAKVAKPKAAKKPAKPKSPKKARVAKPKKAKSPAKAKKPKATKAKK